MGGAVHPEPQRTSSNWQYLSWPQFTSSCWPQPTGSCKHSLPVCRVRAASVPSRDSRPEHQRPSRYAEGSTHLDTYVSSVCHQKTIRQFFSKMAWELEAAAPKSCSIIAILQKNSYDLSNPSHLFLPHSETEISVKSKRYCFKNNFVRADEKSTCCSVWLRTRVPSLEPMWQKDRTHRCEPPNIYCGMCV